LKYLSLLVIIFFIACNGNKTINTVSKTFDETIVKRDTLSLSLDADLLENDLVYIDLLKITNDKDSVKTAYFKFNFYRNGTQEQQFFKNIIGYVQDSDWYLRTEFSMNVRKQNNFFALSNGYPACGYSQTEFLFYNNNKDSGWYSNTIFGLFENNVFGTSIESFSPLEVENANDYDGVLSYSDSITYSFLDNKWIKKRITAKDTTYRSSKTTFDEVHKQVD
jgi:hypothetical protein